jgi:hypothetical protein
MKTRRWMSKNIIFLLMYHRHKLLDLNYGEEYAEQIRATNRQAGTSDEATWR